MGSIEAVHGYHHVSNELMLAETHCGAGRCEWALMLQGRMPGGGHWSAARPSSAQDVLGVLRGRQVFASESGGIFPVTLARLVPPRSP